MISAATLAGTLRGLFSENMNPSASAPASTAARASSIFVTPQILTLTLIPFPRALLLSPEYFHFASATRPRESPSRRNGPGVPHRPGCESRSRIPKSFSTGLLDHLRLTREPVSPSSPDPL